MSLDYAIFLKSAEYHPIKNIDFTSPKGKKRKLDETIDRMKLPDQPDATASVGSPVDLHTGKVEMELLFAKLSICGTNPGVLSLVTPYSDSFIPKSSQTSIFPTPLTEYYNPTLIDVEFDELKNACDAISISLTEEMSITVEAATRLQAKCKLWYKYRSGRITASRMKAVCSTTITNPSRSLIESICYPDACSFSSKQTDWGTKKEKCAKELYCQEIGPNHENFAVSDVGFVINPKWPHLGASPDGVVSCTCHGRGVIEVKCPYSHKGETIMNAVVKDRAFCLIEQDGKLQLRRDHMYYYQVQTQIHICDVTYCDFVVCTFGVRADIFIERIFKDNSL